MKFKMGPWGLYSFKGGVKRDRPVVSFPRVKNIDAENTMNGMMEVMTGDIGDLVKGSCRKESQRNLHHKVQKIFKP